jgi:hypothetical protein
MAQPGCNCLSTPRRSRRLARNLCQPQENPQPDAILYAQGCVEDQQSNCNDTKYVVPRLLSEMKNDGGCDRCTGPLSCTAFWRAKSTSTVRILHSLLNLSSHCFHHSMFTSSLTEEVKALEEDIDAVKDKIEDAVMCEKIRLFVYAPREIQDMLKQDAGGFPVCSRLPCN